MSTFSEILTAAQSLESTERAQLLAALWEDVAPADGVAPNGEWLAEVKLRSDSYEAGKLRTAPSNEVRSRARQKAGLDG